MKIKIKLIILTLVVFLVLFFTGCNLKSPDYINPSLEKSTEGLIFNLKDDDTYEVTGYSGEKAVVKITLFHNEKPITSIAGNAFRNNEIITEVIIGNQIETIGVGAFLNCINLEKVEFGISLKEIGNMAFKECLSLTQIELPASIEKIGKAAFDKCSSLYIMKLKGNTPPSLEETFGQIHLGLRIYVPQIIIYKQTWRTLSNIIYPDMIINDDFAILNGELVQFLGKSSSVTIPSNVNEIIPGALYGYKELSNIFIDESNTFFRVIDGVLYNKNTTSLIAVPSNRNSSVTVPQSVNDIYDYAFGGFSKEIIFSQDCLITTIREYTFAGYKGNILNIPISVKTILHDAFERCPYLKALIFNNEKPLNNNGLREVYYFSESKFNIFVPDISLDLYENDWQWYGPIYSQAIINENGSAIIDDYYFVQDLGNSETIFIPNTIRSIDRLAFSYETRPIEFEPGSLVESIREYYFANYKGPSILLPDSITSIQMRAFSGLVSDIIFPETSVITTIPSTSFSNYKGKNVIIPNSITSIESSAFKGCTNLETITFGKNSSLTIIGSNAFEGCTSLLNITIPSSVISIGDGIFNECSSLKNIEVSINNANYKSIDGVLFNKAGTVLIQYPIGKTDTSYTVPSGVSTIGNNAFNGCINLANISIPDSVISIGTNAFNGTSWYNNHPNGVIYVGKVAYSYKGEMPLNTHITFLEGTEVIAAYAFVSYFNLKSITLPNSLKNIENSAFRNCINLSSINFPQNSQLTNIGHMAFSYCISLVSIALPNSLINIEDLAFFGCTKLKNITLSLSLENLGSKVFDGCSSLTSITIPNSVISIGDGIFYECSSLKNIEVLEDNNYYQSIDGTLFNKEGTVLIQYPIGNSRTNYLIPDSVISISENALYGSINLSSITIPSSVDNIEWYALQYCTNLSSIIVERIIPPTLGDWNAFSNSHSELKIYVPSESVDAYKSASGWSEYADRIYPKP